MECELLRSSMILYRSLLYSTTVLYDMAELRTLAGVFVDLWEWISAELHYHYYFSECSYVVQRIVTMLAKAVG